jgi:hypothetical protein
MVNRSFSKHSILHGNHLPRNVKLAHRFTKQHTRLFEAYKIVFVSKAVNNEGNELAWQVANIELANAWSASFAHHHFFLLVLFIQAINK